MNISYSPQELQALKELENYCKRFGVSKAIAARVFDEYGMGSVEQLQDDTFEPVQTVSRYSLRHAEKLGEHIPFDDDRRLRAYIIVALNESLNNGDTYTSLATLKRKFAKLFGTKNGIVKVFGLKPNDAKVEKYFLAFKKEFDFDRCLKASSAYVDEDNDIVTSQLLHESELTIAKWLMSNQVKNMGIPAKPARLSGEQWQAVVNALVNTRSVLTGGPGTGKTETIKTILSVYGDKCVIVAPTGKAAKRAQQVTGHKCYTAHLALLSDHVRQEVEAADCLIIDEGSMLPSTILANLINSFGEKTMVLVGDPHQLKSVEAGAVLRDTLAAKTLPIVHLTKNFRQGDGSVIAENVAKIFAGDTKLNFVDGVFEQIEVEDYYEMWGWIKANGGGNDTYITAQNNTKWGVNWLNFLYQRWHNPADREIVYNQWVNPSDPCILLEDIPELNLPARYAGNVIANNGNQNVTVKFGNTQITMTMEEFKRKIDAKKVFKVGDKVMHLKNSRKTGLVNGDIGTVLTASQQTVTIGFDDDYGNKGRKMVTFRRGDDDFSELTLASVFTCHKMQGDEVGSAVILLAKEFYNLDREWLGTAASRGKSKVVIIHDGCLSATIKKQNPPRKTRVLDLLHFLATAAKKSRNGLIFPSDKDDMEIC